MITKYKAQIVYYSPSKDRQLTKNEILAYKSYGINSDFADAIKFDSYHEYKVYLTLRNSYIISEVIPHFPIEILSKKDKLACFPTGKRWAVDFIARGHHKETLMLVEAKGVITNALRAKVRSQKSEIRNNNPKLVQSRLIYEENIKTY